MTEDQDPTMYFVVMNHEEQYSIWRADTPVPAGWLTIGEPDRKAACLERIAQLWVDMRPLSLRTFANAE